MSKTCTKCDIEYPATAENFSQQATAKDKLHPWCKKCRAEYDREYGQVHKVKIAKRRQSYLQSSSGKKSQRRGSRENRKRFPERIKAVNIARSAIRAGKLKRPTACSSCSIKVFVEGHHPDYSKPLEVIWLCKQCHAKLHKEAVGEKS